jgi:hypothetical protein
MRIVPDSHPEAFHVLDLLPPSLHLRSLIIVAWMAESELLRARNPSVRGKRVCLC